jgi:hypothetical protein
MTKKRYVPRGSSSAFGRKKDPYKYIRDGKKQQVEGRANLPTARQKDLASYVLPSQESVTSIKKAFSGKELNTDDKINIGVEGAFAGLAALPLIGRGKPMVKSLVRKLIGKGSDKLKPKTPTAPRTNVKTKKVTSPKAQPLTGAAKKSLVDKAEKGTKKVKDTAGQRKIAADIKAKRGGSGKPPTKRKTTTPAKRPAVPAKRASTSPVAKKRGFNLGSTKRKRKLAGPLAGGAAALGTAAYLSQSEKKAKPAQGSQSGSSGQSVNPSPGGAADELNTGGGGFGSGKTSKQPDDGYRFYGKEGTGLGDTSRKYGIQYATQKQFDKDFDLSDGEKAGGRPGRGKMKSQGMNRSKRSGFSGRGSGAALRGF